MILRLSMFAATIPVLATLSFLAGCTAQEDPDPANTGGTSAASGGSGGLGSAGSTAGITASGSGGSSAAGITGSGSGGVGGAGVGGTASTAGASGGDGAIPATFETIKLVFGGGGGIMTCAAAPCHGVGGVAPPDAPLELPLNDDPKLYTNLTTYVSKACNNKLVTPGNPAQSALVTILSGPCGMTPRMPYMCSEEDGGCIPDEYIAAVTQWIANGAPQ